MVIEALLEVLVMRLIFLNMPGSGLNARGIPS